MNWSAGGADVDGQWARWSDIFKTNLSWDDPNFIEKMKKAAKEEENPMQAFFVDPEDVRMRIYVIQYTIIQ